MEGRSLAPPANGTAAEKRTRAVPRPVAGKPPKNTRAATLATVLLREPEIGEELAGVPTEDEPSGLENRRAAKERPSCGSDPSPRRYEPVLLEERRPRGNDPRGPLRGGPERSAKEPQTPSEKTTQPRTKREKAGEAGEAGS